MAEGLTLEPRLPAQGAGRGRLARGLAVATAASAVPLLVLGGSVTTLGAGMAVEGWLIAEGHFLLVFPVEKWFRDLGTFVEHSHRLLGALVGLLAIATVLASRRRAERAARLLPLAALGAVAAQGALGGFRVLQNSEQLAFLHGVVAQVVFALLVVTAAVLAPPSGARPADRATGRLAGLAAGAVLVQITLGAWYRHGLRPEPASGVDGRLHLHLFGALVVLGVLAALAARLKATGLLPRARRRISLLLGAQVLLGAVAWLGFRPGSVGLVEWSASVLHVLLGALLLAQCVLVALALARPARAGAPAARAEGLP